MDAKNVTSNASELPVLSHFLSLNNDCILEIFSRLSIYETFQVKGIFGARIDELCNERIARCRRLDVQLRCMLKYTAQQLMQIGANLYSLKLSVGYSFNDNTVLNVLVPLLQSAGNTSLLHTLTIHYIKFSTCYLRALLNVAFQIQILDLSFCDLNDDLLSELLQNCLDLRKLVIIANYELCGQFLHKLHKNAGVCTLKHLTIELQENWNFPLAEFANEQTSMKIMAFDKGRKTRTLYNYKEETAK